MRHIWINPERFSKFSHTEKIDGVEIVVELSPYDSPKLVTGTYDESAKTFNIRFEYIDDEPESIPNEVHGVSFIEGKFSGKLIKIQIPIDSPSFSDTCIIALRTKILSALESRESRIKQRQGTAMNQRAAKEVIESELNELVLCD